MRLVFLAIAALAVACQLVSSLAPPPPLPPQGNNNNSSADEFDGILRGEKLFVNREDGSTFGVWIEPGEKVEIFQRKIYEIAGVHERRQRLTHGDKFLKDSYLLTNYGIKAGSIITLGVWPQEGQHIAKFTVVTLEGDRYRVSARLSDSVSSLKENITQWTGIPHDRQRLIIDGKELSDAHQLLEYDIWNTTSVHMGAPIETCRGLATINLQTISGATVPIEIDLSDRVDKLKEKIQELAGAPTFVQLLMFREMTLNDPDLLCDYGLTTGSRVYMALISQQISNLNLVGRLKYLQDQMGDPHIAPIFREASDGSQEGEAHNNFRRSIYTDRRNWLHSGLRRHPYIVFEQLNPIAYLEPNPDDEDAIERARSDIESVKPNDNWPRKVRRVLLGMATFLRPYRAAWLRIKGGERAGLMLGATWEPDESPLGANMNNFAPDEMNDQEIVSLFELSERIREQIDSDARTNVGSTLDCARRRIFNHALLRVYTEALAGLPLATENYQPNENEECAICRDGLQLEPAFKPVCGHGYHIDCSLEWTFQIENQYMSAKCPYCLEPFRFSFKTYVKNHLDWASSK